VSAPSTNSSGAAPAVATASVTERLFSLSGLVPLGAFLVVHLWMESRVLFGPRTFGSAAPGALLTAVDVVLVLAPLLFHGAYGAFLTVKRRPLGSPRPYPRAIAILMRISGGVALLFILAHVYTARVTLAGARGADLESVLAPRLSATTFGAPLLAIAYMVGLASVVFHFAVGVWGFFAQRKASTRRVVAYACGATGVAVFVVGANVVTYLATGTRLLGHDPITPLSLDAAPCVVASAAPSASN
jgi:succinate dehydrogenase/fumarate reductase cytochrome b subunit (b558 family)